MHRRSVLHVLALAACACVGSAGCSTTRTPAVVGSLPQAGTTAPLHFYISNQSQSLDPVDIDLYVDDVKLVTGEFRVNDGNTWFRFDFTAEADRTHTVRLVTKSGALTRIEDVQLTAAGLWFVAAFWYNDQSKHGSPEAPTFTIDASEREPVFA